MIKIRGEEMSKAFYESQAAAVDRIEETQKNKASSATSGARSHRGSPTAVRG
jgi:hypothetical protein